MNYYFTTFSSVFNSITILWKETSSKILIQRIFLSNSEESSENIAKNTYNNLIASSNQKIDSLVKKLKSFLEGKDIKFNLEFLDFSNCYDIQKRVLLAEYNIPRGWVSTYKRIANQIEITNGARVVGNALARNPFPIVIPCHRAIRNDGGLGGFQGGIQMKKILLQNEGIRFTKRGKVTMERVYY